ncbi:MAG: glycosyltransferase family 39 protein [Acidobacteriota bacterium]|nr:glycosyltransferase family 39 protein [Acidobacteriota bacterium]
MKQNPSVHTEGESGGRRLLLTLLPILGLGAFVRFWGLPGQILGGDELHAVRAVLELSFPEILVTYRPQDACLPLSSLYRLLLVSPVPFSEMALRLPILLSSLALVVGGPWLLRRSIPRSTAAVFAFLLAISPIFVLYGRIVRSYAPVVLISFAAVAVFYRWLEAPTRRLAVVYVLLAGLAIYFHLVVTAFVLAPVAFAGLERLATVRREGFTIAALKTRLQPLAALAGGVLGIMALFLIPGWFSLGPMIGEKRQLVLPNADTVAGVIHLQSGSTSNLLAGLFYAVAVAGLWLLLRHRRRLGLYTLTLVLGHAVGMVVLRPLNLHLPPQFTRYNLVLIPILLLWVAAAVTLPWWRGGRGPSRTEQGLRWTACAGLLAALVLTSPLLQTDFRTSEFTHHKDFLGFYGPRGQLAEEDVPKFYLRLAAENRAAENRAAENGTEQGSEAQEEAVLEYPWHTSWRLARTPYILQRIHRRPVYLAPMQRMLWDPRIQIHKMIPGRPRDFLRSPARWLVVFADRGALEDRVDGDHRSPRRGWKLRGREWDWMDREGTAMGQRLNQLWGPPDVADETIQVWDLDRVREQIRD